jgi:hypothetical protein
MRAPNVVIACLGVAACGLFPDLADLTRGDAASPDGAADVASVDAGADARTSPCTAVHAFCDDFDHGALGATWDSVVVQSGPVALSTVNVVTVPDSFQATANATGSPSALVKNFPSSNHTHVELDLMIENPNDTTNTEVDFITIELLQPPSGFGYADIGFSRNGGTSVLEEYASPLDGGVATKQDFSVNQAFAAWHHVVLDLTFSSQSFVVYVDGALVHTMNFSPPLPQTPIQISLGAAFVANTSADWNVFVDDFVVDQN